MRETNHKSQSLTSGRSTQQSTSRYVPTSMSGASAPSDHWLVVRSSEPTEAERRATRLAVDRIADSNGYVSLRVEFRFWHPEERRSVGVRKESVILHVESGKDALAAIEAVRARLEEGQ